MTAARAKRPKEQLSRDRIVTTALAIVDADGLDALTMRRLGRELGVDPMAVYYYVEDKNALLDALVEAVMSEIDVSCELPADAEERLVVAAKAYADVLLAHPHALPIVLARSPRTPAAMRPVEFMLSAFMDAGLEPQEAVVAMNTLAAAVRGYVGMTGGDISDDHDVDVDGLRAALSPEEFPALSRAAESVPQDPKAMFDSGVRAVIRGFIAEVSADESSARPRPHHMEGR
jgi:AcrR family transcriptional regulator